MFNLINKFINNLKIKHKLLLIYIIVGFTPFIWLSVFSAEKSFSSIVSEYQQVLQSENLRVKNVLFEVMYLFTNFSKQIERDRELKSLLTTEYNSENEMYASIRSYTNLDIIKNNFEEVSDIHIYFTNPTIKTSSYFSKLTSEVMNTDWYQKIINSTESIIWFCDDDISKNSKLHLGKTIHLNTTTKAILVLSVSDYYLSYINRSSNFSCALFLDKNNLFYTNYSQGTLVDVFDSVEFAPNEDVRMDINHQESLLYGSGFQAISSNSRFQAVSINTTAVHNAYSTTLEYSIWMMVCVLVPLIAIILFVNHFSKRILVLKAQMENITSANYQILSWKQSGDELGILFQQMLQTIDSIQRLNNEILQNKLEKERLKLLHNQMKYEMLASQINPHFLFNSLETIHMKAEQNEDFEVSYIAELLGELLRYSLKVQNMQVSLEEELAYVEKYLRLQKVRLDDHLSYTFSVKNVDANQYKILPMLLQPIIENAIKYGVDINAGQCCIDTRIWYDNLFLYISIHDSGMGMDQDTLKMQLERLRATLDDTSVDTQDTPDNTKETSDDIKRSHIGLANIYQRIKLFYGENYSLILDSTPLHGTTVTLHLPSPYSADYLKSRKENKNV